MRRRREKEIRLQDMIVRWHEGLHLRIWKLGADMRVTLLCLSLFSLVNGYEPNIGLCSSLWQFRVLSYALMFNGSVTQGSSMETSIVAGTSLWQTDIAKVGKIWVVEFVDMLVITLLELQVLMWCNLTLLGMDSTCSCSCTAFKYIGP